MKWNKLKFWRREKELIEIPEGIRELHEANEALRKQNEKLSDLTKKGSEELRDRTRRD